MRVAHRFLLAVVCAVLAGGSNAFSQGVNPKDRPAVTLLFNSWKLPVPGRHLIGNIHYVGMFGVCSFLITTPDGHILIDTTFEECVPAIQKNVEQLGYKMADIKYILSSHAHVDHAGGHAAMKKLTGAKIFASQADAHLLETGGEDDFSPFPKDLLKYTPIKADQIIKDGEKITLGGVTLTAHLTPGHTKGATSWTMPVTEDGKIYTAIFLSSFSIVQGTTLVGNTDYPKIAEDLEQTYKVLKAISAEVYFGPHGDQFGMTQKFKLLDEKVKPNPVIDPAGYQRTIGSAERSFRTQLAREKAAATQPAR